MQFKDDEYEEEIETVDTAIFEDGMAVVVLEADSQFASGVEMVKLSAYRSRIGLTAFGEIVDISSLLEDRESLIASRGKESAIAALIDQLKVEFSRAKILFNDHRNISEREFQEAKYRLEVAQSEFRNLTNSRVALQDRLISRWGKEIFGGKFGKAKNVLIEEFLIGEEMSYFVISDGKTIKSFETAQDHKRVKEGDKGKNTGGMGAYSPSRLINKKLEKKIINQIIKPTIKGLGKLGSIYKGFLYAGLMIVNNNPYLVEYNVRMGDPECQTILPKLKNDLLDVIMACCDKKLHKLKIRWNNKKSLCVVLCSKGYPDTFKKNIKINNLEKLKINKNDYLFHAGTTIDKKEVYATGGRVLNFVTVSNNFLSARKIIHKNINKLNWTNGFHRKDIGFKVIN